MSYSLKDFLGDLVAAKVDLSAELYAYLCQTDLKRLIAYKSRLDRTLSIVPARTARKSAKSATGQRANLIGKIFEKLVRVLLDGCAPVLKHDGNIRSTISEIDFRIKLEPPALAIPVFQRAGGFLIGEAKCVAKGPKTEWINELAGMLLTHCASIAILFTACPSKKLRADHRTAIALNAVAGRTVVPFGMGQIQRVINGENFLCLLSTQVVRAQTHATDLAI